jgi:hypothetical protein
MEMGSQSATQKVMFSCLLRAPSAVAFLLPGASCCGAGAGAPAAVPACPAAQQGAKARRRATNSSGFASQRLILLLWLRPAGGPAGGVAVGALGRCLGRGGCRVWGQAPATLVAILCLLSNAPAGVLGPVETHAARTTNDCCCDES